jgi:uncharacterized membrane protein
MTCSESYLPFFNRILTLTIDERLFSLTPQRFVYERFVYGDVLPHAPRYIFACRARQMTEVLMKKSFPLPLASAAFILGALLWSSSGKADFRVCNFSTSTTKVAFAYYEQQDGWTSRGWMTLPVGECKIALRGPLQTGTYYLYGHSEDRRVFGGKSAENGAVFCIQKPKFKLHSNDYTNGRTLNCEANGLRAERFMAVNVAQPDFTYTLSPNVGQIGSVLAPLARQGLQPGGNGNTGASTQATVPTPGNFGSPPPPGSAPAGQTAASAPIPPTSMETVPSAQQNMPPASAQPTGGPLAPSQNTPAGTACQRFPNLC